jgi:hypothetical protein
MTGSNVTPAQRAILDVVAPPSRRHRAQWWSGDQLLAKLSGHSRTTQGVHQTAASLVRRGYLRKRRIGSAEKVYYIITAKGCEIVAALASLDKQAGRP